MKYRYLVFLSAALATQALPSLPGRRRGLQRGHVGGGDGSGDGGEPANNTALGLVRKLQHHLPRAQKFVQACVYLTGIGYTAWRVGKKFLENGKKFLENILLIPLRDHMDSTLELLRSDMDQGFQLLRSDMDQGFQLLRSDVAQVNRSVESLRSDVAQVNRSVESLRKDMDQGFRQVNQSLD